MRCCWLAIAPPSPTGGRQSQRPSCHCCPPPSSGSSPMFRDASHRSISACRSLPGWPRSNACAPSRKQPCCDCARTLQGSVVQRCEPVSQRCRLPSARNAPRCRVDTARSDWPRPVRDHHLWHAGHLVASSPGQPCGRWLRRWPCGKPTEDDADQFGKGSHSGVRQARAQCTRSRSRFRNWTIRRSLTVRSSACPP